MTAFRHVAIAAFALTLTIALAGCASSTVKPQANDQQAEFKLPPGWTEADMQACMIAATPGKEHDRLLQSVGRWSGTNTMWFYPGAEPVVTKTSCEVTSFMDGRYSKAQWTGEMPGSGPFQGFGLEGYDNVAGQYVNLWVDNMSTGLMTGTGKLSADGSTMTWLFNYTCPVTKKPTVLRQIEKVTGKNTKTYEMYGNDPKTGVEFKMMVIELTRK